MFSLKSVPASCWQVFVWGWFCVLLVQYENSHLICMLVLKNSVPDVKSFDLVKWTESLIKISFFSFPPPVNRWVIAPLRRLFFTLHEVFAVRATNTVSNTSSGRARKCFLFMMSSSFSSFWWLCSFCFFLYFTKLFIQVTGWTGFEGSAGLGHFVKRQTFLTRMYWMGTVSFHHGFFKTINVNMAAKRPLSRWDAQWGKATGPNIFLWREESFLPLARGLLPRALAPC